MPSSKPTGMQEFGGANWTTVDAVYPELAGRAAVVTGGARGLGAQFAEGLVHRGVDVHIVDVNQKNLEDRIALIEASAEDQGVDGAGRIAGSVLDVTDQEAVRATARTVFQAFGRLDFWVNNAGIFLDAPARDITAEQVSRTLGVNVNGVLFGAQAAAEVMSENGGGVIVNMGSVAANRVRSNHADYCAAKAAVEHLTRCLAVEFGPQGIRVNGIGPGDIDTDMLQGLRDDPSALEAVMAGIPLGRIGAPPEVLAVLLFLLSDGARYVTGHVISVDGGSRLLR